MSLAETTRGAAEQLEWEVPGAAGHPAVPHGPAQSEPESGERPAAGHGTAEPEAESAEAPQPYQHPRSRTPDEPGEQAHAPDGQPDEQAGEQPPRASGGAGPADAAEGARRPLGFGELDAPEAFREPAGHWWAAVNHVHEVLLAGDAGLEIVSGAFAGELRARWEYARTLHEQGYHVPEYLSERAPIAPLWPLPVAPTLVDELTRAA